MDHGDDGPSGSLSGSSRRQIEKNGSRWWQIGREGWLAVMMGSGETNGIEEGEVSYDGAGQWEKEVVLSRGLMGNEDGKNRHGWL